MIALDDAEVRRCFDAIEHTNTQALGDMRRLLSLLRAAEDPAEIQPQPSLSRLESLAEHVRASGLPVDLSVRGVERDVPPGVGLSAYRIVQEALTNVLKHAGPDAHARVAVNCGAEHLDVEIANDGNTPVPDDGQSDSHGHGLVGIRERVAVAGGHVDTGPGAAGGYVVRARLPYTTSS